MKYIGVFLLLTILMACSSPTKETSSEAAADDQPGTSVAEIERVEEKPAEVAIDPIQLEDPEEQNLFDLLLAIQNRNEISEEVEAYLEEQLDLLEGSYLNFDLYPVSEYQFFIVLSAWAGASAMSSYESYEIALIDQKEGILTQKSFTFEKFPRSESRFKVLANSIIVADIDSAIYKTSAKFARGLEYKEKITKRKIYYVNNNEIKVLEKSDKATLRQARNHLYAHKGYQFKSEDLQNHFKQYDWYQPQHANAEGLLSESEQEVANYILTLEQSS